MKNRFPASLRYYGSVMMLLMALAFGCATYAQTVTIPGTKAQFTFPSEWSYLNTEQIDKNTSAYIYYYSAQYVVDENDTTLPFMRIIVRKNYSASLFDFVFERYASSPYQSLEDYTEGIGLPSSGGMGYVGAYTNVRDEKDYQFRMVYFKEKNTVVELRLETTRGTFPLMEEEFLSILRSLKF